MANPARNQFKFGMKENQFYLDLNFLEIYENVFTDEHLVSNFTLRSFENTKRLFIGPLKTFELSEPGVTSSNLITTRNKSLRKLALTYRNVHLNKDASSEIATCAINTSM